MLRVVWGLLPQIHAPHGPKTLQEDCAVPIVHEQPGDSGSRFLGGGPGLLCCMGQVTLRTQQGSSQAGGVGGSWSAAGPALSIQKRTWTYGCQHSHVHGAGTPPRPAPGNPRTQ